MRSFRRELDGVALTLANSHRLPATQVPTVVCARPELDAIRTELLDRLSGDSPFPFDVTLAIVCVATMAFITSLRGSSMVAGNPNNPNKLGMRAKHAKFRRELQEPSGLGVPSYTTILTITHFKGKPGLTEEFQLPPCASITKSWSSRPSTSSSSSSVRRGCRRLVGNWLRAWKISGRPERCVRSDRLRCGSSRRASRRPASSVQ